MDQELQIQHLTLLRPCLDSTAQAIQTLYILNKPRLVPGTEAHTRLSSSRHICLNKQCSQHKDPDFRAMHHQSRRFSLCCELVSRELVVTCHSSPCRACRCYRSRDNSSWSDTDYNNSSISRTECLTTLVSMVTVYQAVTPTLE